MHTVVGDYDDTQAAQRAVEALFARDIGRASIEIQPRKAPPARLVTQGTSWANDYSDVRRERDEGFFAGVRHFFTALFGTDVEPQVVLYPDALRRGIATVTVQAASAEEAQRAAEVLRGEGSSVRVRQDARDAPGRQRET